MVFQKSLHIIPKMIVKLSTSVPNFMRYNTVLKNSPFNNYLKMCSAVNTFTKVHYALIPLCLPPSHLYS